MQNEIRFQRLGGSCQLLLEDTSDLRHVTELNDAHWIMTSVRTDSILCDKDFLHFLDSDGNGRIRVDEVKEAIRWMLRLFITPEHIMDGSDELALSSISEQNPEGRDICRTVRDLRPEEDHFRCVAERGRDHSAGTGAERSGCGLHPSDHAYGWQTGGPVRDGRCQ